MFLISLAVTNNVDVLTLQYLPLPLLRTAVDVKLGLSKLNINGWILAFLLVTE
jgi:hypothetical protein